MGKDLGFPGLCLVPSGPVPVQKSPCGIEDDRLQERLRVLDPCVHLCTSTLEQWSLYEPLSLHQRSLCQRSLFIVDLGYCVFWASPYAEAKCRDGDFVVGGSRIW